MPRDPRDPRPQLSAVIGPVAVHVGLLASIYQLVDALYSGRFNGLLVSTVVFLIVVAGTAFIFRPISQYGVAFSPVLRWVVGTSVLGTILIGAFLVVYVKWISPWAEAPSTSIAEVRLGAGPTDRPTAYFGTLESVVYAINGDGDPAANRQTQQSDAKRCAFTVVYASVSRPSATVVTTPLPNWVAVEDPVSDRQQGEASTVRRQLLAPPRDVKAGDTWTIESTLTSGDAVVALPERIVLTVSSRDYDSAVWTVGGTDVTCRLS